MVEREYSSDSAISQTGRAFISGTNKIDTNPNKVNSSCRVQEKDTQLNTVTQMKWRQPVECGSSGYRWKTLLCRRRLRLTTFSKSRAARSSQWSLCHPVPELHQIERNRRADILQMGLCLSDVARSPQVTSSHSLRERPFDPCARSVSLFESRFRLLTPRLLQGAEFSFQLNRQQAAFAFRLRALRTLRARLAVARCELDLNLFAAVASGALLPTATCAACWAGSHAFREVVVKISGGEA